MQIYVWEPLQDECLSAVQFPLTPGCVCDHYFKDRCHAFDLNVRADMKYGVIHSFLHKCMAMKTISGR